MSDAKEIVDIRVELLFQKVRKKFTWNKYQYSVTQGAPVVVFVKATNISKTICKGFGLTKGNFKPFQHQSLVNTIDRDIHFPALNPGEERIIKLEDVTFSTEGSHWFACKLVPDESQEIVSYQYDLNHKKDNKFANANQWGNDVYVVGQHTALQAKTNFYILMLTVITVVEAVFGIKETLQAILGGAGGALVFIGGLLRAIGMAI